MYGILGREITKYMVKNGECSHGSGTFCVHMNTHAHPFTSYRPHTHEHTNEFIQPSSLTNTCTQNQPGPLLFAYAHICQ